MSDRPQPYAPAPVSTSNTVGRVAIVLAILALALGVTQQILSVFAPLLAQDVGAAYAQIAGLFGVLGGIHLLLSIGAVVFGALGLRQPRPVMSAIALGVGAAGAIGGLVGFAVIPLLAQLV